MREVGEVTFVKVFEDEEGRSKGSAIVEFEDSNDAARAIEEFDDTEFMGRNIFVREFREE